ncbi:hypothetical protein NBRC111452_1268 [Companilactobacillus farciminis]|nr:hypothetical protein NBRC111452_1268 [Companilactobacillus farciminis]
MVENDLTKVARIAAGAAQGATYKDAKGDIKIIKPTGDANYMDLTQFMAVTNGTDDGDGGNPVNPSSGIDYYPGSLADGEISQRKLEWSGTDDPTKSNKITFADDPGTKLFGQFDGITILGHIQKTVMSKGVLGAVSNVPINYDPKNAVKAGYYTTTAPYPLYIKTASLPVGQKTDIQITGVGEKLSGKNVKSPILSLTFNVDKTLTIDHTAGYDNDGDSSGATGANYQFVVDVIATFSKQAAMSQLPPSVNLFSGSASGNIVTVGPSEYYENVMDGLEVTFDDYATIDSVHSVAISNLNIDKTFRISKEQLIMNNVIDIPMNFLDYADSSKSSPVVSAVTGEQLGRANQITIREVGSSGYYTDPHEYYAIGTGVFKVTVSNGKINVTCTKPIGQRSSIWLTYTATLKVTKVTTYKD